MALLNRPFTDDEIKKILLATPIALFNASIFDACYEDRHDAVSYTAASDHVQYQTPEVFFWHTTDSSPSDCVWMVPRTVRPWYQRFL